MKKRNIILSVLVLLCAAGCAYQQRGAYGYSGYGRTTTYESDSLAAERAANRALEESVRSQINRYGDLAADAPNVQIACRDGAVTLSGTVQNERDKQMMEACVRNTSGVLSVDDQLAVSYPATGTYNQSTYSQTPVYTPPAPAPAPPVYSAPPQPQPAQVVTTGPVGVDTLHVQVETSSDADRDCAQRVIDTIQADPAFTGQAPTITVSINGGRAFIYGTAESRAQRRAIVDAVKRVPGIVDVRDEIHLR